VSDKLRLLSLFAGIGGFELGLERSGGFKTVAQCEIDPYCNKVLAKHWPEVKRYGDIRELTADRLAADGIAVDAICGGFPCQDVSKAGAGEGIAGARSGLWFEYARLIGELRPQVVFVENVAELCGRGLGDVLGSLAEIGYDATWDCIPASAIGRLHKRERLWLTAYPNAVGERCKRIRLPTARAGEWDQFEGLVQAALRVSVPAGKSGGVSDGLPDRAHRLKALGNAVVPQIPELLGRAYLQAMETTHV
jgi:DNA (cytosine-5)-methyltransferase 1